MKISSLQTGKFGEQIAAIFLKEKGYRILEQNHRTKLGEIDIIASYKDKIHFIEVKTRVGIETGYPYESVTKFKQNRLKRAAEFYVLKTGRKNNKLSLDVVSIVLKSGNTVKHIDFFENIY